MSDNPLGDWLRERHEALGEAATADTAVPPGSGGSTATWPEWAAPAPERPAPTAVRWDEPPGGNGPPSRRRRRLLLLATLPWLVAGGLGAAALAGGTAATDERPSPPAGTGPPGAGTPVPASPQAAGARDPSAVDPAFGAAAAIAVRLSVTTPGQGPEADERRYVDLAVPEAMRWYGEVAVVTVGAVVLEGPADHWQAARPARFAVPVGLVDGQAAALGEPWALGRSSDAAPPGAWQPASADPAAIADAVEAAGFAGSELLEVSARPDLPGLLRARVTARAPGEGAARDHHLWLAAEPDLAVLGADR